MVAFVAPCVGVLFSVLLHVRRQQWREEDEDAVCDRATSQISNLVSKKKKSEERLASHGKLAQHARPRLDETSG